MKKTHKVMRGSGWCGIGSHIGTSERSSASKLDKYAINGFRIVLKVKKC
jgi:hypothetical protein